jgi:3'-5' exoribonuclease
MKPTTEESKRHLSILQDAADHLPVRLRSLTDIVIYDPLFVTAPGGVSHHHAWVGGLLQHTSEVVAHIDRIVGDQLDMESLLTAAIWHDYMKTREYVFAEDGTIQKTEYHARIGHVAGSYVEFVYHARKENLSEDKIETIGHIMLAHHGRLEWRSPVEPQTPEAFILHTADMLSARG